MPKDHRLKTRKPNLPLAKSISLNFLLGCPNEDLGSYELARLANVADIRKQVQVLMDQINEQMGLAWLAAWFRSMDRTALSEALENEESALEWAKRKIREKNRGEGEETDPVPPLQIGAAHLAAALRYQERNIAEGLCAICPQPQDRNSGRYCTKHLTAARTRAAHKAGVKGEPGSADYLYGEITESTHGRQPGTLAALAMNREKKTRAMLAELGISPESTAVSLKAAKEALLESMPDSEARAMKAAELFEKAGVITKTTGRKALQQLLSEHEVQRIGRGARKDPYRYFLKDRGKSCELRSTSE